MLREFLFPYISKDILCFIYGCSLSKTRVSIVLIFTLYEIKRGNKTYYYYYYLEWIPGIRNLLADSLSRLLDVVPDAQKTKEPDDHEFGSYCFEELEPAKVMEKVSTELIELTDNSEYQNDSQES